MATTYDPYAEGAVFSPTTETTTLAPNRARHGHRTEPDEPSGTNPTLTILLTAAAIVLAVCLVGLGLIIQVFILHVYHITGGAVYTTAPLGRTLTVAHVSTVVVGLTAPLTIGFGAYWLAGKWLAASRDDGLDRPTPYQLGILMKTINGASISALLNGSAYMFRRGTFPGGKTLDRPPILRNAVLMLFTFLGLAYASTGADFWLGATSTAVLYPVVQAADGGASPLFGHRVNQTQCDETKDLANNKPYQCGLIRGSGGNAEATATNLLTLNAVSNTTVVAFTDDSTAIMVPPPSLLPANLDYTATSPGVKSVCTSITSQCVGPSTDTGAGPGVICPASSGFNSSFDPSSCPSYQNTVTGGPLDATGQILPCSSAAASTEFQFGTIIRSSAYVPNNSSSNFVGDTGFYFWSKAAVNVVTCDVKSLTVTYRYFNGSYTLLSASPSDVGQGQRVSDGSFAGPVYVPPAIEGVGISSGNYIDAFAQKLSQVALSMTAYIIEPTAVVSTLVLVVTALAVRELRRSPHTAFARSRLADPTTAIGTAYGPDNSKLKMASEPQELFGDETAADRLNVGVSSREQGVPAVRRSSTLAAQSSWEK
ncbi:hypothetical protein B0H13DRAFT_2125237 [Mycena leptocephala]|nr:hypothetical protein B0H13DRAFT_2125237 [Mycena leptocephala]